MIMEKTQVEEIKSKGLDLEWRMIYLLILSIDYWIKNIQNYQKTLEFLDLDLEKSD